MAIKTFPVTLKRDEDIAPGVKHLAFEREDGELLDFTPGQFISVHFEHGDKVLRRSYSLANRPKNQQIEFALSYVEGGAASNLLFGLKPGDKIDISGPYGRLTLRDNTPERYILVATGTGVTPYRSMLPELAKRLDDHPNLSVELLLGVQKRADALYEEEFLAFAKQHPRFHFHIHFSREHADDLTESHQCTGYVQTAFSHLKLDPATDMVYLCGNPNMIDESVTITKAIKFPIQQVVREKYIS